MHWLKKPIQVPVSISRLRLTNEAISNLIGPTHWTRGRLFLKRNPTYIYLLIFLVFALPWSSAVGFYNDIAEADFLSEGNKFENADLENFVADKSCAYLSLPCSTISGLLGDIEFSIFDNVISPLVPAPFSKNVTTLRC
jgi:hypothetical protein